MALSGRNPPNGVQEKSLISNFELLNLVPTYNKLDPQRQQQKQRDELKSQQKPDNHESTKWRRVGLVLGRKVHLDTIVW